MPTRYFCPIFCCFLFNKNAQSCFKRKILEYSSGDYSKPRNLVYSFNWSSCFDSDISKYAENLSNHTTCTVICSISGDIAILRFSGSFAKKHTGQ